MRSLITSYFGVIVAGSLVTASAAQAQHGHGNVAEITPYKATYALTFEPNGSNSPFRGGSGRLTIEITGSRCTEYRIVRSLASTMNSDRGPLKIQSEAVFAENAAGTQFAFSLNERNNTGPARQVSLVARREAGRITVTSGGRKTELPGNAIFPVYHERMLLAAIRSGRKSVSADVYNPEETLNTVERISFTFGPEVVGPLPKGHAADIDALRSEKRKRVDAVFRNTHTGKIRAQERMTRFHNNIMTISHARFDQLQVKASLAAVTMLPRRSCN
jgi:hypothetical protein